MFKANTTPEVNVFGFEVIQLFLLGYLNEL